MIRDPRARGAALADWLDRVEASAWVDLADSGLLPPATDARDAAPFEHRALAAWAAVRALVATGGFDPDAVAAVDHLNARLADTWFAGAPGESAARAALAARFEAYGRLGQSGAGGAEAEARPLGEASAERMTGAAFPPLAEALAALHDALVVGATEVVRAGAAAAPSPREGASE